MSATLSTCSHVFRQGASAGQPCDRCVTALDPYKLFCSSHYTKYSKHSKHSKPNSLEDLNHLKDLTDLKNLKARIEELEREVEDLRK